MVYITDDERGTKFFKDTLTIPKGLKLYHYTSPQALLSILSNPCLHFTNSKFFLDKSEITYAYDVLHEAANKLTLKKEFKETVLKFCKTQNMEQVFFDGNPFNKEDTEYNIVSFSTQKDDLFMWNSYTKTDNHFGYSLEFDAQDLLEDGLNIKNASHMYGFVDYNRSSQVLFFCKSIK